MGGKNKKLKNECTDIRVGGGVSIALLGCFLSEELFRPTTRFKGEVLGEDRPAVGFGGAGISPVNVFFSKQAGLLRGAWLEKASAFDHHGIFVEVQSGHVVLELW